MGTHPAHDDGPAIRVDGLRKTYGSDDDAIVAVDDVSFEVGRGEVVGLLGPNGAGKTTTIKSLLGLIIPDAGSVEIAGIDVHVEPDRAYRHVGAMLEGARNVYWRLTPRENLAYFAGLGGDHPAGVRDRHETLLEQFGLADHADETVNDLSRGMKQKVSLATTLARDVEVVFMDEPTLGLDIETSIELRAELRRLAERESVTIVLCSHDMDVIEAVCDRVVVMQDGAIVANDTVQALLDVFRTRAYRVRTDETPAGRTRDRLEDAVDADITTGDDAGIVEFTARDGEDFYAVVEALRDGGLAIRDIDAKEPDLEEVFLHLTGTGEDDPLSTTTQSDQSERADAVTPATSGGGR